MACQLVSSVTLTFIVWVLLVSKAGLYFVKNVLSSGIVSSGRTPCLGNGHCL